MKTEQIKMGAQVHIPTEQHHARVWRIVEAELMERGLLLTLERDEGGQTYRNQEWATDCEPA